METFEYPEDVCPLNGDDQRDEPEFFFSPEGSERVRKKLALFMQYIKENNGELPDSFVEDLDRLYGSVDREFDAQE